MGKGKALLTVLLGLLLFIAGALPAMAVENVRFEVDKTTVVPGENVIVNVYIDSITEAVYGASFDFVFDPGVVQVLNNPDGLPVAPGTIFPRYYPDPDNPGTQIDLARLVNRVTDNPDGTRTLSYAMFLLSSATPPNLSGNNNLFASFILRALAPGTVNFNITSSQGPSDWRSGTDYTVNFKLANAEAGPIAFSAASSAFTVQEVTTPEIAVAPSQVQADLWPYTLTFRLDGINIPDPNKVFVFIHPFEDLYGGFAAKLLPGEGKGSKYSKQGSGGGWGFSGPAVFDSSTGSYSVTVPFRLDVGRYKLEVFNKEPFYDNPPVAWGSLDVVPPAGLWVDGFQPWKYVGDAVLPEGYNANDSGWALHGWANAYNGAGVNRFELVLLSRSPGVSDYGPIAVTVSGTADPYQLSWDIPTGIPAGNYEAAIKAYDSSGGVMGQFTAGRFVVGYPCLWWVTMPYLPANTPRFFLPFEAGNVPDDRPENVALIIKDESGNEVARAGRVSRDGWILLADEISTVSPGGLTGGLEYSVFIRVGDRESFPYIMKATAAPMLAPGVYPPVQKAGATSFFVVLKGYNFPSGGDGISAEVRGYDGALVARSTDVRLFQEPETGADKLDLRFQAEGVDGVPQGSYHLEVFVGGAPAIGICNEMEFTGGVYFYGVEPGQVAAPVQGQVMKMYGWNLPGHTFTVDIRNENGTTVWSSPEDVRLMPAIQNIDGRYQEYIAFELPALPEGKYSLAPRAEAGVGVTWNNTDFGVFSHQPPVFAIIPATILNTSLPQDVTFDLNGVVDYSRFTAIYYVIHARDDQTHYPLAQGQAVATSTPGVYKATIPRDLAIGSYVLAALDCQPAQGGPPPFAVGLFDVVAAADTQGPVFGEKHPTGTITNTMPEIWFTVSDTSGINISNMLVTLDRTLVPVSPRANTPGGYTYTPANPLGYGDHSVVATVYDTAGNWTTDSWSFTVAAPPGGGGGGPGPLNITTDSLPNATQGQAYSFTLEAAGGTPPYTWSLLSGSLPAGLSLSSAGVISGTPTVGGNFSFTVQVTDSSSSNVSANRAFNLTVNPGAQAAPTVTVGSAAGLPADTLEIPITIDKLNGMASYGITLQYDPAVVTPTEITNGDVIGASLFMPNPNYSPNSIKVANSQATAATSGSVLCQVKFRINESAAAGTTTDLVLTEVAIADENG